MLGYEIREAVEAVDLARAARLRVERDEARFGSTMALADTPEIPSSSLLDEIEGLDESRLDELRDGFLIGAVLGDPEWQTRAVVSAIVGQPVRLPRLDREREIFRAAGFLPVMWNEILLEQTLPPPLDGPHEVIASLSADARSLLCVNALLRRRLTTPRHRLGTQALLRPPRLTAAIAELASRGLADEAPSIEDLLDQATVAQLGELREAHGVKSARNKRATIRRLVSAVPERALREWMQEVNPAWVEVDVARVGLGQRSEAITWYEAFARLFAHSLQFQVYTYRDVLAARRMDIPGWEVLRTDDCPVCGRAPTKVAASDPDLLPPFHLGCRCAVVSLLERPGGEPWLPPR
jgi:hypothetical protein